MKLEGLRKHWNVIQAWKEKGGRLQRRYVSETGQKGSWADAPDPDFTPLAEYRLAPERTHFVAGFRPSIGKFVVVKVGPTSCPTDDPRFRYGWYIVSRMTDCTMLVFEETSSGKWQKVEEYAFIPEPTPYAGVAEEDIEDIGYPAKKEGKKKSAGFPR